MKLLCYCMLILGILSCNAPKGNAPEKVAQQQEYTSSSPNVYKDTLYVELKRGRFPQGDSIVIQYSIKNATKWHYVYLPDECWVERYEKGEWMRLPDDVGTILMGKEIPAQGCVEGHAMVSLSAGHYRFCSVAYTDDARIDKVKTIMKAEFEVIENKHSN